VVAILEMKTDEKLYHYKAKIDRVVDGDTVDVSIDLGFDMHSRQRVRLWGINTPECRTRDKREKALGLAAKARLIEILGFADNRCVIATRLDRKGKFGRVLGILYVDDLDINEQLIEEGHAVEYYGGKKKN
jgi:endonuclease YncB( thermonuclease family)